MAIWMDLTNSFTEYKGNVVGIIRAELMLAKYFHELNPSIRFSVLRKYGFEEVPARKLAWLWKTDSLSEDYLAFQKSEKSLWNRLLDEIEHKVFKHSYKKQFRKCPKGTSKKEFIIWPYKSGDVVYSCGWYGTNKERFFSKVKKADPNVQLVYTVYDLAMLQDSLKSVYKDNIKPFDEYLEWIASNCDEVVYGGHTAQIDAEKYFSERGWRVPAGHWVKWGSDIKHSSSDNDSLSVLGIKKPFILSVGSFDWKKNYQVLYRAYCWAASKGIDLPTLVIVGRMVSEKTLFAMFQTNPQLKGKVKIISASDEELGTLYKNCLFTVLPTLYEGWSLTLPESFNYGKLCLCSDVAPLREIGEDLAVYLNPQHPTEWAKTIEEYANNKQAVQIAEDRIKAQWQNPTWKECAENLCSYLSLLKPSGKVLVPRGKIYYDLGLINYNGKLTGIPRTSMLLARYLYQMNYNPHFFFIKNGNYYAINEGYLEPLLKNIPIDEAVCKCQKLLRRMRPQMIPFTEDDVVFNVMGLDDVSYALMLKKHKEIGFKYCNVLFDFTPITVPQTHPDDRVVYYPDWLKRIYALSDFIFYGGRTAEKDGETFQKKNKMKIKPSIAIKWGSDIVSKKHSEQEVVDILEKCGVEGDYILTVGTIEARKNQRILYDAYLELMQDSEISDKLPQLLICGNKGWKTEEFRKCFNNDERIKGKVLMFTPTDEELDVLYQNCKFTCLASLYEGWSLTLPESLNYGKFCLTADTPSLVEAGEDIVDYANPYDPVEWAEKIKYYVLNPKALKAREALIKKKWHNTTWAECAEGIGKTLKKLAKGENLL